MTCILFAWDSLTLPLPSYLALTTCPPLLNVWVWMASYRVVVVYSKDSVLLDPRKRAGPLVHTHSSHGLFLIVLSLSNHGNVLALLCHLGSQPALPVLSIPPSHFPRLRLTSLVPESHASPMTCSRALKLLTVAQASVEFLNEGETLRAPGAP